MTLDQLIAIMPEARDRAAAFVAPLNAAMVEFGIITEKRVECFLAQALHESGRFGSLEENLNYSSGGLANTWAPRYAARAANGSYLVGPDKRHFPNPLALALHRKPQRIANNVYANRLGNRDEESNDGWTFRGAGIIQLTGRTNQQNCAKHFGIPLEQIGAWLRTPVGACRSAAWFWLTNGCNELADAGKFNALTERVNGGSTGLPDRLALWQITQRVIS